MAEAKRGLTHRKGWISGEEAAYDTRGRVTNGAGQFHPCVQPSAEPIGDRNTIPRFSTHENHKM